MSTANSLAELKAAGMTLKPTHPIHWGIGGLLLGHGLLQHTLWGKVEAAVGIFVLAAKTAEALSRV